MKALGCLTLSLLIALSGCSFKKHSDNVNSIDSKAHSNHRSSNLFTSVATDSADDVSLLLDAASPAQLQQVNEDGDTLMHVAIKRGNAEIIALLNSHGLSIYKRNIKTGIRALYLSKGQNHS